MFESEEVQGRLFNAGGYLHCRAMDLYKEPLKPLAEDKISEQELNLILGELGVSPEDLLGIQQP